MKVVIPRINMNELYPEFSDKPHPAFIDPDGILMDSITVDLNSDEAQAVMAVIQSIVDLRRRKADAERGETCLKESS